MKLGKRIIISAVLLFYTVTFNTASAEEYIPASKSIASHSECDFGSYMAALSKRIQNKWNTVNTPSEEHATVVFKLNRQGELISAQITESSGNKIFDQIALNTVIKSAPFDAFPLEADKDSISIKYSFESSKARTDIMKQYLWESEKYYNKDNKTALLYIDKAIEEVKGDCASYFLYARRCKINKALGNLEAAENDVAECKRLKNIYDEKRINAAQIIAMEENSPLAYFSLASAYDAAGRYNEALIYIDKAISMTPLNQAYKRYKLEIVSRADTN